MHTYARECCRPADEVTGRLAVYYDALAETESAKGPEGYARLDPERAHLMRLLRASVEGELWAEARSLVWAVDDYLEICGYWTELAEALELGVKAARALERRRDEGAFLGNLGLAYKNLRDARRAVEYHEQALAIAREIGDRRAEGADLGNLGLAYADLGDTRRAIEYYEQALTVAREIGDRRNEEVWLDNLGSAHYALGDARRAAEYYEQALAIAREIGDRRGEGNHLANIGLVAQQEGDPARARDLWCQALAIYEAIEDPTAERVRGWLAGLDPAGEAAAQE